MRIQIAAAGIAGMMMLAFGLVQIPAASASTGPRVGETVYKNGTWHKYESVYWSLPGRIALIEPFTREVKDLTWHSWTRTGGIANGVPLFKEPRVKRAPSSRSAARATGTSPA
jgi:hypothetical protein